MTGKFAKFAFKTFNKNASALDVPSSVQSFLREAIETLTMHGSIIQELANAANLSSPDSEGAELQEFGGTEGGLEFDEVDLILHQEVFGP